MCGGAAAEGKDGLHVAVVYSSWNGFFVEPLLQACRQELSQAGARCEPVCVPGAGDLVAGVRAALRSGPSAVMCVGVLIRGESDGHARMCQGISLGLARLNAQQDVPIINGVVMCQTEEQAMDRTHGAKCQAGEWTKSAIHMAKVSESICGSGNAALMGA